MSTPTPRSPDHPPELARLVVDQGWTYTAAAKMFMVAPPTAKKRTERYCTESPAGMATTAHAPTTAQPRLHPTSRCIVGLLWRAPWSVQIADRLAIPTATAHAVLVRCRINRLSHLDRTTCEPCAAMNTTTASARWSTWTSPSSVSSPKAATAT